MSSNACLSPVPLVRPFHVRARDTAADILQAIGRAWRRRSDARRRRRELQAVADMNRLLLRDIGVPEEVIEEAELRDTLCQLRQDMVIGRLRGLM